MVEMSTNVMFRNEFDVQQKLLTKSAHDIQYG